MLSMAQYAKNIGTVITRHRMERDIMQHALATAVELSETQMAAIEDGKALPSLQRLIKIANYLKIKPGWLLIEAEIADLPDDVTNVLKEAMHASDTVLGIVNLAFRAGESAREIREIYEGMKKK
ncbi:MAG: helix-turn-helix transcriptional regulator [Candidatus Niyogibacteria bacterium]|nr:helix-turn-helix transcriptional regulator [Candidatus Niyogibacteria bacterium]